MGQYTQSFGASEIPLMAPAGMIGMGVSYNRSLNRPPRVDVKIARWAVKTSIGHGQQISHIENCI
jgi:hypothetical protein